MPLCFAYLEFERPTANIPLNSLLIGSKLDFDIHSPNCRIAFFGKILQHFSDHDLKSTAVTT